MIRQYTITGRPATKKTSQRIVKRKSDDKQFIIPSKITTDWTKSAIRQLKAQHVGPPVDGYVSVTYNIHRAENRGDLSNFVAAIDDALQAAGVIANDKLILALNATLFIDRENPRVLIWVITEEEEDE